jgi:hypothetical protein
MKRNDWLLIISTAIYSYLFYKEAAGINFFIFSVLLTVFLLLRDASLLRSRGWLMAALSVLISGAAVAAYGNWLSVWANIISLSILSGYSISTRSSVIITLFHSLYSYTSSMVFMVIDGIERKSRSSSSQGSGGFTKFLLVLIPLLVTLLFFFLYRGSNAIFNNFAKNINFDFITWSWVAFTFLGFLALYGFFYHKRIKEIAQWDENAPRALAPREVSEEGQGLFGLRNEYILGMLLFVMLNILLFIVNMLDVQYLYVNSALPEGVSHSGYVHQGVELLILSIIIAIAIILFVFRGNMNFYSKNKTLRVLAALWILQNMFMVVSTILRNNMYIAEYGGITYKRIGVYVYLGLSLIGLLTTWIKIGKKKSNWFLFRVNSLSWWWMLVLASLVNWDALITNYNMGHAKDLKELDKNYLIELAPSTLPEMLAYNDTSELLKNNYSSDTYMSVFEDRGASYGERTLENKLHGRLYKFLAKQDRTGWQSWNYDDSRILREVRTLGMNDKVKHLSLSNQVLLTLTPLKHLGPACTNVRSLDAHGNALGNELNELSIVYNLEELSIANNGIDSLEKFPRMASLKDLDISGNTPHSFYALKNAPLLEKLNLSSCRYVNLQELPAFQNLDQLDLSSNTIYFLEELRKFKKLSSLSMRSVSVDYSPKETLPCIPSLKTLDLSYSELSAKNSPLLEGIVRCWNIGYLDLSGNALANIYPLTRTVKGTGDSSSLGLQKLNTLILYKNDLQTITGTEQFTALEVLNISDNRIKTLQPISALQQLRVLYAARNPINDFSALAGLTKLEVLDLEQTAVIPPAMLKNLTSLQWLNISNNSFSEASALAGLSQLKTLYAHNNELTDITAFSKLSSLEILNLEGNSIRDYSPLYKLKQLKELYVGEITEAQMEGLRKALPNTAINGFKNSDTITWRE